MVRNMIPISFRPFVMMSDEVQRRLGDVKRAPTMS